MWKWLDWRPDVRASRIGVRIGVEIIAPDGEMFPSHERWPHVGLAFGSVTDPGSPHGDGFDLRMRRW